VHAWVVCVCVRVCMHVCTYARMHVCTYANLYVCNSVIPQVQQTDAPSVHMRALTCYVRVYSAIIPIS